jgi:hypothetical protein
MHGRKFRTHASGNSRFAARRPVRNLKYRSLARQSASAVAAQEAPSLSAGAFRAARASQRFLRFLQVPPVSGIKRSGREDRYPVSSMHDVSRLSGSRSRGGAICGDMAHHLSQEQRRARGFRSRRKTRRVWQEAASDVPGYNEIRPGSGGWVDCPAGRLVEFHSGECPLSKSVRVALVLGGDEHYLRRAFYDPAGVKLRASSPSPQRSAFLYALPVHAKPVTGIRSSGVFLYQLYLANRCRDQMRGRGSAYPSWGDWPPVQTAPSLANARVRSRFSKLLQTCDTLTEPAQRAPRKGAVPEFNTRAPKTVTHPACRTAMHRASRRGRIS